MTKPKQTNLVVAVTADIGQRALQDVTVSEIFGTHYCRRVRLEIAGGAPYRLDVRQGGKVMKPAPSTTEVNGQRLTYHIAESPDFTSYVACEIAALIAVWKHSIARERTEKALKEL